ncbi:MAG TPA: Rieske 2Fe-2S domain-containing protein [Jatrophihabitantaceae bacterium]|jgi:thiosulfate dehydrogenase [quinone] large subunit|nr:Rieske 2Fe-2S domain-containing protein [Jatrophihabitantaceae bacterium]
MTSRSPNALRDRATRPGWVLLPLRAFLAVVYLDGGISKIADRRFLAGSSPLSMHASVLAVRQASPIGGLLGPVAAHSFAFGLLMAVAEIAVGIGLLLGLFTRVAAIGGAVLALSLWLTVSWGAQPWFTSADLVYLFAFTPLIVAGAGDLLSLDGWLSQVAARQRSGGSRAGAGPAGEERTRRVLVGVGAALLGLVVLGGASVFRRPARSASAVPAATGGAIDLAQATQVPVGGGKQVTDPVTGHPVWVLQLTTGAFSALDAICPHQGCPVQFVSPADGFACPCHGSHFTSSGARISGPAPRGLTSIPVTVIDGEVRRG